MNEGRVCANQSIDQSAHGDPESYGDSATCICWILLGDQLLANGSCNKILLNCCAVLYYTVLRARCLFVASDTQFTQV